MNEHLNPEGLAAPSGFCHVVRSRAATTILVAGQVAYDEQGNIVGENDLATQVDQVYRNLERALAACGATFADVVKTTLFVKDMTPEKIAVIRQVRARYLTPDRLPASTMIGVQALAKPALMLEVEATAMLD
ncbi:RidA family protein [Pigmentiphaga kullae]|uniref:Enamine deaminase RidA (YjgF/YER057c/UK114 family) n=1 Tax=Pigmentiphaga kullae TaxID=151784 RepID=A0A4Q7NJE0_9BURK|nr:RidA family protein [Pigmentiphaga kullae]RZS84942.1 enamine deaminase RidA (YjgF/YER057c/UK114 family) [Pigmentiphaga kullae]